MPAISSASKRPVLWSCDKPLQPSAIAMLPSTMKRKKLILATSNRDRHGNFNQRRHTKNQEAGRQAERKGTLQKKTREIREKQELFKGKATLSQPPSRKLC